MMPYPLNLRLHSNEALETIARQIISQFDPSLLYKPAVIPVEDIMEKIYGLTIEFLYIRKNGRILGETVFEDAEIPIYEHRNDEGYKLIPVKAGTVIIDASLLHKGRIGRLRFTCAHELAHWVIDKNYFMELGETASLSTNSLDSEFACEFLDYDAFLHKTGKSKTKSNKAEAAKVVRSSETDEIIERQANRMASRILMPKCTLKATFHNTRTAPNAITTLAGLYGVSKQAMEIRLKELGLVH